jgi:hypothetical protein
MIKTITAHNPTDLDYAVNSFERAKKTVFATQTHFSPGTEGCRDTFIAVVFYR